MKRIRGTINSIFWLILYLIPVILCIVLVGFVIYVWIVYGGKPITEIPAWALWLIWNK